MSSTNQTSKEEVVTLLQQIAQMIGLELTDGQMRVSLRLIEAGADPDALVQLILQKRREQELTGTSVSSSSQHSQQTRNFHRSQYVHGSGLSRLGKGKVKHEMEYTNLNDLDL